MTALNGLRVLNTRALDQAGELNELLHAAGAVPLPYPCIAIHPVEHLDAFDQALRGAPFDWVMLTSQNAVEMLASRAHALGIDHSHLARSRYATVGSATAASLQRRLGLNASFQPDDFRAEALAHQLPITAGERVMLPVSDLASLGPAQILTDRGAEVSRLIVYRTILGSGGVDAGTLLKDGRVGAITFTSPSAVSGFVQRLKQEEGNLDDTRQVPIACIGPSTRNRAISENMLRAFCPEEHTLHGLLAALDDVVTSHRLGGRLWG